jgi:1-acyl-sn-glycerol-3-phosphate acyltransferase
VLRWRAAGVAPDARRFVVIAAPHTSNWDFFYGMLLIWWFGLPFRWIGKKSLFEGPIAPLMRACGGMPIDRSDTLGLVADLAARFANADVLMLGMAPEGTRGLSEYWKSGFYRIAMAAEVPVVLCFLDYQSRSVGFGPAMALSGNKKKDMDRIRAFFSGIVPLRPENYGPIRLRDE